MPDGDLTLQANATHLGPLTAEAPLLLWLIALQSGLYPEHTWQSGTY